MKETGKKKIVYSDTINQNIIEYRDKEHCFYRNYGPALICEDGTKAYLGQGGIYQYCGLSSICGHINNRIYLNPGICHRDFGPAVIYPDGYMEYYKYGKMIKIVFPNGKVHHG